MGQRLFFDQTEIIRQQGIQNQRIVEALMKISADNPSNSVGKDAKETLMYLGITPPPLDPKLASELSNRREIVMTSTIIGAVSALVGGFLKVLSSMYFNSLFDIGIPMWINIMPCVTPISGGLFSLILSSNMKMEKKSTMYLVNAAVGFLVGFSFAYMSM